MQRQSRDALAPPRATRELALASKSGTCALEWPFCVLEWSSAHVFVGTDALEEGICMLEEAADTLEKSIYTLEWRADTLE